jgi:hypothetical protein
MKKVKLALLIFILGTTSINSTYAQWVTWDPGSCIQGIMNAVNNIEAVSKTTGETMQVFKQSKALYDESKQYYDALKKVKNVLKDAKKVSDSAKMVEDMSQMFIDDFTYFTNDPNLSLPLIDRYMRKYNRTIRSATLRLKDLGSVLGNYLSMSDKERMDEINKQHREIYILNQDLLLTRLEIQAVSAQKERREKERQLMKQISGKTW